MNDRSAQIDRPAFDALLAFLARDESERGPAYDEMRERLETFFRWKKLDEARELADETLDRVAKKIAAGETVSAEPARYVLGVARLVALEAARKGAKRQSLRPEQEHANDVEVAAAEQRDHEARIAAIEAGLDKLAPQDRDLLLRYHQDEGRSRIEGRHKLAEELGVGLNVLRVRMFRIRARLERALGR